jgi:predicted phosphodiesterase
MPWCVIDLVLTKGPTMKIAVLNDIHGNSIALDAVLKDIGKDVDKFLFLGDYAAIGHDPVGVFQRVNRLPNSVFIRGNTDRYLTTPTYPG